MFLYRIQQYNELHCKTKSLTMRLISFIVALALTCSFANAQMIIDNQGDPESLVSNLAFTNNLEVFNITFTGDTNQFGSSTPKTPTSPLIMAWFWAQAMSPMSLDQTPAPLQPWAVGTSA